jgi:hypothetical protein
MCQGESVGGFLPPGCDLQLTVPSTGFKSFQPENWSPLSNHTKPFSTETQSRPIWMNAAGSAMSSLCQGKGPRKSPADAVLAVTRASGAGVHRSSQRDTYWGGKWCWWTSGVHVQERRGALRSRPQCKTSQFLDSMPSFKYILHLQRTCLVCRHAELCNPSTVLLVFG